MTVKSILATVALCLVSAAALAETTPAPATATSSPAATAPAAPTTATAAGHHWQACAADVQKFCGTIDKSVHGAVRACLTSHTTDLSDGCKTGMAERAAAHATKTDSGSTKSE